MTRLTIVAHWDARGEAAPHFLRLLDQLSLISAEMVVASPSPLTERAAREISRRAILIRRSNEGHDFGSWHDALKRYEYARGFTELLLTNDSYVGFFRPVTQIVRDMEQRRGALWGLTKTDRHGPHVQSYFLMLREPALRSNAFMRFWTESGTASGRGDAIINHEVRLSATMLTAGFEIASYFEPTRHERLRANRRGAYWVNCRHQEFPDRFTAADDAFFEPENVDDPAEADHLNWSSAFADAALGDGRLPVTKFDVLRFDPFYLGSDRLLRRLERQYPAHMAGVREYLADTREFVSPRPHEHYGSATVPWPQRATIGYGAPLISLS